MNSLRRVAGVVILGGMMGVGGCVTDPSGLERSVPPPSAQGVYIVNEGNFGRGNTSLSYYDLDSRIVYQDVFEAVNGRGLGDVANSMYQHGDHGYIIVNNSDRLEVLDLASNASVSSFSVGPGRSPREMVIVEDTLGFVTCLYDASVVVVHLRTGAQVDRITVGPNPEGIALAHGKAYVANSEFGGGRTVSVLDVASRTVVRTLDVGDGPLSVGVTPSGAVYVLCSGFYNDWIDPLDDTPCRIAVIDPTSDTVVDSVLIGGHASTMAVSADGLCYVPTGDSVLVVDTRSHRNLGAFLAGSYYSVAVDQESGDVYLADANNYVQAGTVSVYAPDGLLRTRFDVGVNPGHILFKRSFTSR